MTNREKLNSMTDEEFAEWLCKQIWPDYEVGGAINILRYNTARNFLKLEYKEVTHVERPTETR